MNWEKCVAEKTINKIEPDKERVRRIKKSNKRQIYKINDKSINIVDRF